MPYSIEALKTLTASVIDPTKLPGELLVSQHKALVLEILENLGHWTGFDFRLVTGAISGPGAFGLNSSDLNSLVPINVTMEANDLMGASMQEVLDNVSEGSKLILRTNDGRQFVFNINSISFTVGGHVNLALLGVSSNASPAYTPIDSSPVVVSLLPKSVFPTLTEVLDTGNSMSGHVIDQGDGIQLAKGGFRYLVSIEDHGFVLPANGVLPVRVTEDGLFTYSLADATIISNLHDAYIVEVIDDHNFMAMRSGLVKSTAIGPTLKGTVWLDDSGGISNTGGTIKKMLGYICNNNLIELYNPSHVTQLSVADPGFVFTWDAVAGTPLDLATRFDGTYNYLVNWGDGNSEQVTTTSASHVYTSTQEYTVTITGVINGWSTGISGIGSANRAAFKDVLSWGPLLPGTGQSFFYGCGNLTISATDVLDTSACTTFQDGFTACTSIVLVPNISAWVFSLVTSTDAMFRLCTLANPDVSGLDMSNVSNAQEMFEDAPAANPDVTLWDTGSLSLAKDILQNAASFDRNMAGWDVTAMNGSSDLINAISNSGMSQTNYDLLLIGWGAQAVQSGVTFGATGINYTLGGAAEAGRDALIAAGWTITGDIGI